MDKYQEMIESKTIRCFERFQKMKKKGKDAPRDIKLSITAEPWHRINQLLGKRTSYTKRVEELYRKRLEPADIAVIVTDELLRGKFEDFKEEKD